MCNVHVRITIKKKRRKGRVLDCEWKLISVYFRWFVTCTCEMIEKNEIRSLNAWKHIYNHKIVIMYGRNIWVITFNTSKSTFFVEYFKVQKLSHLNRQKQNYSWNFIENSLMSTFIKFKCRPFYLWHACLY